MSIVERIILDIVVSEFPETKGTIIPLSMPPKKELGDFTINLFSCAKAAHPNPPAIAKRIADIMSLRTEYFTNVSSTGGYVNFFLTNTSWKDIFDTLSTEEKPAKNETVVVDYIGANAGKPLHIGHICTPSIGQAILNTHKYLGYNIIGDSHFGDWGGIFGKLIFMEKLMQTLVRIGQIEADIGNPPLTEDEKIYQTHWFRITGITNKGGLSTEEDKKIDDYIKWLE